MNSQIQEFDLEKIYVASKPQFHICETGLKTVPTTDYCKSTFNTMYKAQYLEQFLAHSQYYYYQDAGMLELSKLKDEQDASSWMKCT